ncbi:R-spondin-3-like isoform X2 [Scleropages formosus]|uniref:R-spondin-3-like isoform X2 n=1 Tax=Scleropages formosus TaxID=113540 RepID=UPI000878F1CA|nr:R-spondin-3-like isoform X2 [Scleropages formosus]
MIRKLTANTGRHRWHRVKSIPGTPRTSCYGGCLTCSDSNGCLSCKPRYFFLLDRLGMRQVGMCLLSCPSGYYHIRSRDINKCSKCQLDCDCDFTGNFCTRCRAGHYLYRGKCQESCPEGLKPNDRLRECVFDCAADCDTCLDEDTCTRCRQGLYLLQGKCHSACPEEFFANEQLMECKPQVHCEVGEWGSWSPCFRGGSTCGFKLGEQIRTRDVLLVTPSNSHPCPAVSEKRDCISKKKKCPGQSGGKQRDRKNKTDRKIRSSRQEGSERENGKQMRDWADAVNRNITKSW